MQRALLDRGSLYKRCCATASTKLSASCQKDGKGEGDWIHPPVRGLLQLRDMFCQYIPQIDEKWRRELVLGDV